MRTSRFAWLLAAALLPACNEGYEPVPPDADVPKDDAGQPGDGGDGSEDAGVTEEDAGPAPAVFGGMTVDTPAKDQSIDLFGRAGHRIWVEVSDDQLAYINADQGGGGCPACDVAELDVPGGGGGGGGGGEPEPGGPNYQPGGSATFADHVVVEDAKTKRVADYGKLEVKLVGQSTGSAWTRRTIPNLRFDTDEYQPKLRIGGFEHFRLNNGQVGSIYRELIAHRIYRALGYPGLRATLAKLGSNVWGEDNWIPMTLIEVYKKKFCDDNQDLLGGTCTNIWEFAGDPVDSVPGDACQLSQCDNTRLNELGEMVRNAPEGEGFKAALESIIDWPRFHQFQCLSWALATGDDHLHNNNNVLIIERDDGKLVWAPYSVDISAGQAWYPEVSLYGESTIARRCELDPTCWADTISTCREMIEKFDALNPETIVEEVHETLRAHDMIRPTDEERGVWIREWYAARQDYLATQLELYVEPRGPNGCPNGLEMCRNGMCGTPEECAAIPCADWEMWCESLQACIFQGEECPVPEPEPEPIPEPIPAD